MVVMFIIMVLPVLALAVFWFLSLSQAIPVYVFCLLLSGSLYWLMRNNMRRPITTGAESLIGKETVVTSKSNSSRKTIYLVRVEGEIWNATSPDRLNAGESALITGVQGNRLTVRSKEKLKEVEAR